MYARGNFKIASFELISKVGVHGFSVHKLLSKISAPTGVGKCQDTLKLRTPTGYIAATTVLVVLKSARQI